ncbi:hypothetical protein ACTQ5R_06710 [Ruoffia tabacinasalis]|uniref:hypothetical protein n=1 Tax=Ruoffia tabacinasalis TaxID=87458 RepID=UPI003F9B9D06
MTQPSPNISKTQLALIDHMLEYNQYRPLLSYIKENTALNDSYLTHSIQLAQAFLDVNIREIEQLAPKVDRQYLLKPTFLERRVYSYAHYMNVQFERFEYMDYFRALSPLLVDLLRLIIEEDFMPELSQYIQPIVKETVEGKPVYRGLQWKQAKVEEEANKVAETFTKYYGDRFNYKHYVSSSHLLKLIDDHSRNDEVRAKAISLRHIEKYVRNIVAHEVIYVSDELVERRTGMNVKQIHRLLQEALILAGLDDKRQWAILNEINKAIKNNIQDRTN